MAGALVGCLSVEGYDFAFPSLPWYPCPPSDERRPADVPVVELLVHSAAQLCPSRRQEGGPQRGSGLGKLGLIPDGAVAIAEGRVVEAGPRCGCERAIAPCARWMRAGAS